VKDQGYDVESLKEKVREEILALRDVDNLNNDKKRK
jgi:hypothetical protein